MQNIMENTETNINQNKEFLEVYVLSFTKEALERLYPKGEDDDDEDGPDWEAMGINKPNKNKKDKAADLLTKENTFWKKHLLRPGLILELMPYYLEKMDLPATELITDYGDTYICAGKLSDFEETLGITKKVIKPDYV